MDVLSAQLRGRWRARGVRRRRRRVRLLRELIRMRFRGCLGSAWARSVESARLRSRVLYQVSAVRKVLRGKKFRVQGTAM